LTHTPTSPPRTGHGGAGNAPPGAGEPIVEGMFLLIGLAGLYTGKKIFDLRKPLKVEDK